MPGTATVRHEELRKNGSFNHRADKVSAEIFDENPFFLTHMTSYRSSTKCYAL